MDLNLGERGSFGRLRREAAQAPMLDADTERRLLAQASRGSSKAMQQIVDSHMRLVLSIVSQYSGRGVSKADLVSEGTLGLLEAARRFDAEKGTRFSTYAAWWVRAFVRRHALSNRRLVGAPSTRNARRIVWGLRTTQRRLEQNLGRAPERGEVASVLGVSEDEVAMVEGALGGWDVPLGAHDDGSTFELPGTLPDPEQETATEQERKLNTHAVAAALSRLSDREREIVRQRLLADDAASLSALGERFGVSRERVRQIQKQAETKLRDELYDRVA